MKRFTVILTHSGGKWEVYDLERKIVGSSFHRRRDARKLARYMNEKEETT